MWESLEKANMYRKNRASSAMPEWDGQVLAGMQIEAVGSDRQRLEPGVEGELRIRGPQTSADTPTPSSPAVRSTTTAGSIPATSASSTPRVGSR